MRELSLPLSLTGTDLAVLAVCLLAGWLAGGVGNWAADVLPGRGAPASPGKDVHRTSGGGFTPLHYLTLPWYPFRRGVCPHCGERRPLRPPLLEASMMVAFLLTWGCFRTDPIHLAIVCLYAAFLLTVLVIDLEHRRVLNIMVGPAALVALLASFLPGYPDPLQALLGGVIGYGAFMILALLGRGALGAGDVKLAGVIGLMAGYPAVIPALMVGVILGGVAAIALLVTRRAGRKSTFAYAPYLALGAMIVLLVRG